MRRTCRRRGGNWRRCTLGGVAESDSGKVENAGEWPANFYGEPKLVNVERDHPTTSPELTTPIIETPQLDSYKLSRRLILKNSPAIVFLATVIRVLCFTAALTKANTVTDSHAAFDEGSDPQARRAQ